jgi:CobQ-like glutamine amidotransferase family enzyme
MSAELMDISYSDMGNTFTLLYKMDKNDTSRKYCKINIKTEIDKQEINLPFWGVSTSNKPVLRMSGNSIEIDNIFNKYYIFVEVEKTISEIRDEKIEKLLKN